MRPLTSIWVSTVAGCIAAPQDRTGLVQSPLGVTRFRVTFTSPGTFDYFCALHDVLDMEGKVVVHP